MRKRRKEKERNRQKKEKEKKRERKQEDQFDKGGAGSQCNDCIKNRNNVHLKAGQMQC